MLKYCVAPLPPQKNKCTKKSLHKTSDTCGICTETLDGTARTVRCEVCRTCINISEYWCCDPDAGSPVVLLLSLVNFLYPANNFWLVEHFLNVTV